MQLIEDIKDNINLFVRKKPFCTNSVIISNTNRVNMTIAFTILYYKERVLSKLIDKPISLDKQLSIVDTAYLDDKIKSYNQDGKKCLLLTKDYYGIDACEVLNDISKYIALDWKLCMSKKFGKETFDSLMGERWAEVYKDLSSVEFIDSLDVSPTKASISIFSSIKKNYRSFKGIFITMPKKEYGELILRHLGRLSEKSFMVDDALSNGLKFKLNGYETILFNTQNRSRLWAVNKAKQKHELAIGFSFSNKGFVKLIAASNNYKAIDMFNFMLKENTTNTLGNSLAYISLDEFNSLFYNRAIQEVNS